ncbi:MAG: Hsp20/alpha crystallin family protein [Candidatus Omnitrophica bacterium]|nr:Hsp20/alpha crystallin family protein [Candidatus Omnitrophota bacterium]
MRNLPLARKHYGFILPDTGLDRLFDEALGETFMFGPVTGKPFFVDVYEKDRKIVVKAEIPGAKPEDIKLSVDRDILTISGEKKEEHQTKKEDYYHMESFYGRFERAIELPAEVEAEEAKAVYKEGVLKVELPRTKSGSKKEIKIEIK